MMTIPFEPLPPSRCSQTELLALQPCPPPPPLAGLEAELASREDVAPDMPWLLFPDCETSDVPP